MWEQLQKTEAERIHFRKHSGWVKKELIAANKRATNAMDLVWKMREVIDQPAEVLTRANLWTAQMTSKGHITGMKLVSILVDFEAWIKGVFKDMQQLVGSIDPLVGLDQAIFTDLPGGDFVYLCSQPHPTL